MRSNSLCGDLRLTINTSTAARNSEFFTVLLVFLPESGGIRLIPGIPRNRILAVVPAKIGISVPRNSGGFRNGHGITETESTGTESAEFVFLIVIVIFNSNSNYLMVITVD
jgi:hypothetical protein